MLKIILTRYFALILVTVAFFAPCTNILNYLLNPYVPAAIIKGKLVQQIC